MLIYQEVATTNHFKGFCKGNIFIFIFFKNKRNVFKFSTFNIDDISLQLNNFLY